MKSFVILSLICLVACIASANASAQSMVYPDGSSTPIYLNPGEVYVPGSLRTHTRAPSQVMPMVRNRSCSGCAVRSPAAPPGSYYRGETYPPYPDASWSMATGEAIYLRRQNEIKTGERSTRVNLRSFEAMNPNERSSSRRIGEPIDKADELLQSLIRESTL